MSDKYREPEYRWLGRQPYETLWHDLKARAAAVAAGESAEVIWCAEHEPVYTTGRRGIDNRIVEHLPAPMVCTDRGGETTFHGPGQLMLYPVIDLRGRGLGVKSYVCRLEQSCIDLLAEIGIEAARREGFPGVWSERGKMAALGVRVSGGVAYHGMALNVDVDPQWFAAITPCGLSGGVVSISAWRDAPELSWLAGRWRDALLARL